MIQVLIAEVDLGNTDEFGIELGLQDSVLFDRSVLSNIQTMIDDHHEPEPARQSTTQTIVAANNTPGFNFNNQPLGNSGAAKALANAEQCRRPGAVELRRRPDERHARASAAWCLSASSESVSVLLRALSESHRLEVLSGRRS